MCHGLLFKQLSAWMLHGITSDPYHEFFIQRAKHGLPLANKPTEGDDDDDDLGIMGLTGRQLQVVSAFGCTKSRLCMFTIQQIKVLQE